MDESTTKRIMSSDTELMETIDLEIKNELENLKKETAIQEAETKRYEAIQKQKEKQREAIKALLEHTGGNIPALFNEVNEELRALMKADKKLELDKSIDFTKEVDSFRIPKFSASFNLDGSSDFFGMTIAEQELLYDRVGLFKGMVVDHTKETPLDQSFRNVVKFLKDNENDIDDSKPVKVFYKKPKLSAYFESSFTLDESQTKVQEAGIFNMGVGLSVDHSALRNSYAMRAGYAYSKESLKEKSLYKKEINITSNYFLPKIELSFDSLQPCASNEFIRAVEHVFTLSSEQQFSKLLEILQTFGHFIPTSLTIGGRLFSSENKKIEASTSSENELSKHSAEFKLAISTWTTDVGVEGKLKKEDSAKTAEEKKREEHRLKMRAMGGEGAYINDLEKWIQSLAKYTHWALVKFDNLIPSIQILPKELYDKCDMLLKSKIAEPNVTIESLQEQNAHFLFYNGYYEKYGINAMQRYVFLKSTNTNNYVLSVIQNEKSNDVEVQLKPFTGGIEQQWWLSPDGKIVSKNNPDENEIYVLALNDNKLVINQNGYFSNQYWHFGGGLLKNEGAGKYLVCTNQTVTELKSFNETKQTRSTWLALTLEKVTKLQEAKVKTPTSKNQTNVSILRNGYHLEKGMSLKSTNSNAELLFTDSKLTLKKGENTVWYIDYDGGDKLELYEGKLTIKDTKGKILHSFLDDAVSIGEKLVLLDNGNLELINVDGNVIWETNTMTFSLLKRGGNDSVLSIHHYDFVPDNSYANIRLTTMPYIKADHQLWYINGNNQIISKVLKDGGKLCIESDDNGSISLKPLNGLNKAQQWSVSSSSIVNNKNNKQLNYNDDGTFVNAINSNSIWSFLKEEKASYAVKNEIKYKVASPKHEELNDEGYQHVNLIENFIDVEFLELNGKELRGVQLYKKHNRLAFKAIVNGGSVTGISDGHTKQTHFEDMNKRDSKFTNAPIYLPENIQKIGFHKKADNTFSFRVKNSTTEFINSDFASLTLLKQGINDFFDTSSVIAADDEKVVGFGLTRVHTNRLGLYILTLKKQD